jgi:ligand-binding SRPBCC domain-containing protein
MPEIEIITEISAPIEICFDLARSIDLHKISTAKTNEQAIDGKTSGLIELNEFVTWEALHFGIKQKLTSKITAYERPYYFVDIQVTGAFKSFYHKHTFEEVDGRVIMKDYFEFHSSLGVFGKLFNKLFLTKYMERLLIERNKIIKDYAETGKWKILLTGQYL